MSDRLVADYSEEVRLYGEGMTVCALAKRRGVTTQSVHKAFKHRKVEMRSAMLTADYSCEIALYKSGSSLQELAEIRGVRCASLHRALIRRGVKMRPQGSYMVGEAHSCRAVGDAVGAALRSGEIARPSVCERCGVAPSKMSNGASGLCAHHDNYNKRYDIRWLCRKCHKRWHRYNEAVHLKGE